MVVRLDPLKEAVVILAQVVEEKKKVLTTLLEEMKIKLEEPVSS